MGDATERKAGAGAETSTSTSQATATALASDPSPDAQADVEEFPPEVDPSGGVATESIDDSLGSLESDPSRDTLSPGDVVSILDSTREEVRAHRSQLYGVLAAAFLLPLATIAVQTSVFLKDFYPWACAVVGAWALGLFFLLIGLSGIAPSGHKFWRNTVKTDSTIADDVLRAIRARNPRPDLVKAIEAETGLLGRLIAASSWFHRAAFFFLLGAGAEFIMFVVCAIRHVHKQ